MMTLSSSRRVGQVLGHVVQLAKQSLFIIAVLSAFSVVDCCWRRRTRSRDSHQSVTAEGWSWTTTPLPAGARLDCDAAETADLNCLNGGTCYVVTSRSKRYPGCACTPGWIGPSCERRYVDPEYWASHHEATVCTTVSIIAAVFGIVILVVLAIITAYLCHRHRKRTYELKRRQQEVALNQ